MAELVEQKVALGSSDVYGRRVVMTRARTSDGKTVWRIESEPVSQRDEGERMTGLTDRNIAEMVDVLRSVGRG